MLTIYSAQGSPGASTTAMHLAALWAATGTEVLLIEADPGGGSLSHHLGIQFTPGSASFVASGLPVRGGNLIDHSQDVLFSNLHVMPLTSSPTGAREIVKWLGERAGEFRDVAEAEMAVIIDGGRVTADSASAALTTFAAGVTVVARGDSSPTSLEHIGALLSPDVCGEGVERCVVTVGDSPLSEEEWLETCDMTFCGAIKEAGDVTGDLAAFLNRNKRKSKKWRVSLEHVAGQLLPLARPAEGGARPQSAAAPTEGAPAEEGHAPASSPVVAQVEPEYRPAPEVPDGLPVGTEYAAQPDPYHASPAAAYGEVTPPFDPHYPQAPVSPFAAPPAPDAYGQYPPGLYDPYGEQPPEPPGHVYHEAPPPFYETPLPVYQPPPPPPPPPPPAYQQHPQVPQQPYLQPPEPPPTYHPQPPDAASPVPPGSFQPPRHPIAPPSPPAAQATPPAAGVQPPPAPPAPPAEPTPGAPGEPEMPQVAASGSFRDWAARMHGQAAQPTPNHGHGGAS